MPASITFTATKSPRRDFALETAETVRLIADSIEEHAGRTFSDGEVISDYVYADAGEVVGSFTITQDEKGAEAPVQKPQPNPVFMAELTAHYMAYIARMFDNAESRPMLLSAYSDAFDEQLTEGIDQHYVLSLVAQDVAAGPAGYVFRDEFRSYLDSWGMTRDYTDELFEVSYR